MALFAIRGYLRALTTFSTFSVEAVTLLAREEYIWAIYHITTADDDSSGDWYLSEVMVVATGVLLRGQRHQGEVLYDWLRRARVMGITGGAAYREIAGYGCHDRLHAQSFFEFAGELPVEVAFAMTESDAQKFLEMLAT